MTPALIPRRWGAEKQLLKIARVVVRRAFRRHEVRACASPDYRPVSAVMRPDLTAAVRAW